MTETSAELTLRILKETGVPPKLAHGPDFDAVFDPFWFEGDEYFYYYNSSILCWQLGRALEPARRSKWPAPKDGSSADVDALNGISFMPQPKVPTDFDAGELDGIFRGPFLHGDRKFIWFLAEPAKGWELALESAPDSAPTALTLA